MKLIDLLVQELPKRGGWPEGAKFITQDGPCAYSGGNAVSTWGVLPELRKHLKNREYWTAAGHNNGYGIKCFHDFELCQDYLSSIVERQEYEAALAASKQPVWSGEGLPPVGTECEWLASGDHDWMRVKVLAYHEDEVWLQPLNGAQSFTVGNPDDFRPIRTEAERKREEAIDAISNLCHRGDPGDDATAIYDAIASGKIPGVKLSD